MGLNGQEKSFQNSHWIVLVKYINVFILNFKVKVSQRYFIWPVLRLWGVQCQWLKQSKGLVLYLWDTLEVQYCPLKSLSDQYCPRICSSNWSCCRIKILHQQVLIYGPKLVSLISLVLGSIGVLPLTRTRRVFLQ